MATNSSCNPVYLVYRILAFLFLSSMLGIMLAFIKTTEPLYSEELDLPPPRIHHFRPVNPRSMNMEDPAKGPSKVYLEFVYKPPKLAPEFWHEDNRYRYNFKYLINEPRRCSHKKVDILLIVLTSTTHHSKRHVIRKTWGHYAEHHNISLHYVFLLGETRNKHLNRDIKGEVHRNHDIIMANFTDSYGNLTYKTLSGLTWAKTYCPSARFVYKVDDDAKSVSRSRLIKHILQREAEKKPITREILCKYPAFYKPAPIRHSENKWFVSKDEYPDAFYPELCLGSGGYVITMDAIQDLIDASLRTRYFWLEDVYTTGILRTLAGNINITEIPPKKKES